MIILSPLLFLAWCMFPFAILVQCVGVRDELALAEGPFEGRLRDMKKQKASPPPPAPGATATVSKPKAVGTVTCPTCGADAPKEARFCPDCRSTLRG